MTTLHSPVQTYLRRRPSRLGAAGLVVSVTLFALMMGYVCAVFPASFTLKLAVIVLGGGMLLIWSFASRSAAAVGSGAATRGAVSAWLFLLGACPNYLPFKFGPLPGLNPVRLAFAAVLLTAVHGFISSPSARQRLVETMRSAPLVFLLFLLLPVWQLVCALVGDQPVFSIYYLIKVLFPAFVMLLVAMAFFRDAKDIQRAGAWLLAGAVIACIAGLIEWRTRVNPFVRFFPVGVEESAGLEWVLTDKTRGGDYRVSATFAHPLVLAEFICMTLPFAIILAIKSTQRWVRTVALAILPVLALMIYLSYTRSALVAAVSSVIFIALMFGLRTGSDTRRPALALVGWGVVVVVIGLSAVLSGSLGYLAKGRTEAETGSSQARVIMFNRAQALLVERPVQGYGPGLAAIKVGRIQPGQRTVTIDSYFLSTVIETGYVGLTLFVLCMATFLVRTLRVALRTSGIQSWLLIALGAGVFASLVVKLVLSLTENLDLLYLFVGLALVAAMPLARAAAAQKQASPPQRKPYVATIRIA